MLLQNGSSSTKKILHSLLFICLNFISLFIYYLSINHRLHNLILPPWKRKAESASLAFNRIHPNFTADIFYKLFGNGQSHASTRIFLLRMQPLEYYKDLFEVSFIDTDAFIHNRKY